MVIALELYVLRDLAYCVWAFMFSGQDTVLFRKLSHVCVARCWIDTEHHHSLLEMS
jgi:hypothetical protein